MKQADIERLVLEEDLTITDVIDVVIALNSIIGVGLITLSEGIAKYITDKIKPTSYEN